MPAAPADAKRPARAKVAAPANAPSAVAAPTSPPWRPGIHYVPLPTTWMPMEEPRIDKLTRSDVRLALTLLIAGTVAVFVVQVPLLGQVVVGAPLFEEAFKLGLALLPCALLRIRTLAVRLPMGWAVGAGFGVLEHAISYPSEETYLLYGRIAFHGLSTGLSMLVLHGLATSDRRLRLACTLPSSFIHAGNNTAAMGLALLGAFGGLQDPLVESIGLRVAELFLVAMVLATVTWPMWMAPYRTLVERYLLPRLGPPHGALATSATTSTSSRS